MLMQTVVQTRRKWIFLLGMCISVLGNLLAPFRILFDCNLITILGFCLFECHLAKDGKEIGWMHSPTVHCARMLMTKGKYCAICLDSVFADFAMKMRINLDKTKKKPGRKKYDVCNNQNDQTLCFVQNEFLVQIQPR